MNRKSWDDYFLDLADMAATRSTCSRLHVGAVVVGTDYRVRSMGYNGAPAGFRHCVHLDDIRCTVSVHAEDNAITSLEACLGSTLYLTHSPCANCSDKIGRFGIARVVYRRYYGTGAGIDRLLTRGVIVTQDPNWPTEKDLVDAEENKIFNELQDEAHGR